MGYLRSVELISFEWRDSRVDIRVKWKLIKKFFVFSFIGSWHSREASFDFLSCSRVLVTTKLHEIFREDRFFFLFLEKKGIERVKNMEISTLFQSLLYYIFFRSDKMSSRIILSCNLSSSSIYTIFDKVYVIASRKRYYTCR